MVDGEQELSLNNYDVFIKNNTSLPDEEFYRRFHEVDSPKILKPSPTKTQVGGNHYSKMAIQPIDYILANKLDWCEANVIKYITRWRQKNGRDDLEKAKHYIDLLIEREFCDSTVNS